MIARLNNIFQDNGQVKYLFKSSKSNKFDRLQLRTKPMMTDIKSFVKKIVLAGVAFLGLNTAVQAQCVINYDGNPCVGTPIRFTGSNTGTTHDWNFNNENTQSGLRNVNYAFKTSGNKTITYVTTVNGTKCTATLNLVVYESPTIKLKLRNLYEQCFEKNLFCFDDSSFNKNGKSIKNIKYLVGDGQFFEYPKPALPQIFCFSVKDERGGLFDLFIEVEDENGCVTSDTIKGAVKVREKIGARFTSNKRTGCDSVLATMRNISRIDRSQVKCMTWRWGDGVVEKFCPPTADQWAGPGGNGITRWFKGQGTYNSTLFVETADGCIDSFTVTASATVVKTKAKIIASKDSTCISDPKIDFTVDEIPQGATGLLWTFGDPNSGPQNTNNRSWAVSHSFTGLGPFLISLKYGHPICGVQTVLDTILIIGPSSVIEVTNQRIAEHEVFQCPKDVMDTVHFNKNFSTFYHNDRNYTDDDSTFYKWNGTLGHNFTVNNQTFIKVGKDKTNPPLTPGTHGDPLVRQRVCAVRIWDFGDTYAPKCTTDITRNKNRYVNCQYSNDSLPVHYYKSWDLIMLSDFKNQPMEDALWFDSIGLCKRIEVWPSDSFAIIQDSILFIPRDQADSAMASDAKYANAIKKYQQYKWLKGPGERYVEDSVTIYLGPNDTVYVNKTMFVGSKTSKVKLKDKDLLRILSKTDSALYEFSEYTKRDTLPLPLLRIRLKKGEKPKIIRIYHDPTNGGRWTGKTKNFDYMVNYKRFRELYYSRIPQCNQVKLKHVDTCHVLKCESEATKSIAMLHANAGGVGSGLLKDAIECLGAKNPQYGITFILSDLKPGCTFSQVEINFDSACNPNGFVPLSGLSPGARPPRPIPYLGYGLEGNPPSRYSKQYSAAEVCDPSGCITVGIIVGNGVRKPGTFTAPTKDRPMCSDTQWYRKFACFPLIDPAFEVVTPKFKAPIRKICKGDDVVVRILESNKTRTEDLKSLRWTFETGNAGPDYAKQWRRFIQEDYFRYQALPKGSAYGAAPKGSKPLVGTDTIYNYLIQTRGGDDPYQLACSNVWNDGITKISDGPDTLITAKIWGWKIAADASAAWDIIKDRLDKAGFDPFSISPTQLAAMIWNRIGVVGQPATGARGCIDTMGFGKFIRYYYVPDTSKMKIVHPRDTNINPLDKNIVKGFNNDNPFSSYKFNPIWDGYHIINLAMTSANGKCDDIAAFPIIVGFAMELELNDSIVCQDEANTLSVLPKYKMFHPDPINFGTWDFTDYWRNPDRLKDAGRPNREPFTKWDWNKADDNDADPKTKFGGSPYGGTGVGTLINPYVQLGGGGPMAKYYKNDSGVYVFRNIAGDSTGCIDTVEKRLFITRLDVKFDLNISTPSCNSIIEFYDSTQLHDPCRWAMKNCNGPTPMMCDYVREWFIDWGDGRTNLFKRAKSNEAGLPDRIAHKYTRNGWFQVTYVVKTDQGCGDTFKRWIKIPGPRPRFEFTTIFGDSATICEGDSIQFSNLTDSATSGADWIWYYGDKGIDNRKDPKLWHQYKTPGLYYVFLEQYDSLIIPPNIKKYCNAMFPDTPTQSAFRVRVIKRDTVRGSILKPAICVGDSNTFIDFSDTALKTFGWRFLNMSTGDLDTVVTANKTISWKFNKPGTYRVTHLGYHDPNKPRPWCPTVMPDLFFLVDSVVANFSIDSSTTPDFKFTREDINGVTFRWGYYHQSNIKLTGEPFVVDFDKSDKVVSVSYTGTDTFWICFEATNATGCKDTICKSVSVNQFITLANVFTPGDDKKNDVFRVPIAGYDVFELRIFNRFGERVFITEDPKKFWNGQVNNDGPEVPSGTYFYQLTYRFKGKTKVEKVDGTVNVIRPQ